MLSMLLVILFVVLVQAYGQENKPCLIVFHIGKVGGESLHKWFADVGLRLWSYYGSGGSEIFDSPSDRSNLDWSKSINDADVIMGHFSPSSRVGSFSQALSDHNFTRECEQYTILRDPIDLQVSMLSYLYPDGESAWEDCLSNPLLEGLGPCQERGRHPFLHSSMCHTFDGQVDNWNRYDYDRDRGWPATCKIDKAQETLSNMNGVGFLEHMEHIINAWVHFFGLPASHSSLYTHSHKTPNNKGFENLPFNIQMTLLEMNREDIILHRWAQKNFNILHQHSST